MKSNLMLIVLSLFVSMLHAQQSKSQVKVKNSSTSTSISVSSSDSKYDYSASFEKEKTDAVKRRIESSLGKANEQSDRIALWDEKGYTVTLRQGKVEINVDKSATTKSVQVKMEDLGDQISKALDSPKTPEPPTPPTPPTPPSR